ncbi:D-alanine--D-alanine ligase [Catenovulum sp. 2E275]|uniref:D-alanine--D-alanine ligase n=1 Tax=Catenovulum sp. 2E275 TaxID=2980497 RepID=UPI0021D09358|nr:D-alanine--D-alanine ligase [Catenovulum sp. 2E275]MCU4674211.1 D-alanine--D-alanine ligase [Catenovulum sp. 2E275]
MSQFAKVAVVYGGESAEREISLKSGKAVHKALVAQGVDAELVDTKEISPLLLKQLGYQAVFIALHGRGGEDGVIQGLLESLKLPYTGSRVLGSALAMDKIRTKQVWQSCQLPTAKYVSVKRGQEIEYSTIMQQLGDVVFVKPAREGSSIGMSRVTNAAELEQAVTTAFEFDETVLIEQWINGPEYTVSILNGRALPAIRMQTQRSFYDYEAKYLSNSTEYLCPCGLSETDEIYIQQLALEAFDAVGASVWGRIDIMRDADGQFYLLEANTVPGMTEKSLVPMAAKAVGLSFEQLVLDILQAAR